MIAAVRCNEHSRVLALVQLNVYPGLKGLKELLGTVPAWIHYEERERVEVLFASTVYTHHVTLYRRLNQNSRC